MPKRKNVWAALECARRGGAQRKDERQDPGARRRVRGQEKAEGSVPVDAFVERVKKLIETKAAGL